MTTTFNCCMLCQPGSTRAAKTGNFTPSCMMRRCSLDPSECGREKWSSAMDLCLPTCFLNDGCLCKWGSLRDQSRELDSFDKHWLLRHCSGTTPLELSRR